jgi:peptidoglycan hydrolase CwlO-like protein
MRKYTPEEVRQVRQYGIDNLKNYIKKLKKNVEVFEEAIAKEKKEIKKTRAMIEELEADRKEQKEIQKMLKRKK